MCVVTSRLTGDNVEVDDDTSNAFNRYWLQKATVEGTPLSFAGRLVDQKRIRQLVIFSGFGQCCQVSFIP